MKRNWDTIRKILLLIEQTPDPIALIDSREISDNIGIDNDEIAYHCKLMIDAKLIEGECHNYSSISTCTVKRLTWDGHELLDKIRNEKVWQSIKTDARTKGIDLSLDLLKELATNLISKILIG